MALPIIGALAPVLGTVIDRLIPDKAEAAKVKMEIEAHTARVEADIQKSILDLAKEDAKAGKGGYRWGAGWLCVISLGYAWIVRDMILWGIAIAGMDVVPPPELPGEAQYSMLVGMLGLAGVRSYDLMKGSRK